MDDLSDLWIKRLKKLKFIETVSLKALLTYFG